MAIDTPRLLTDSAAHLWRRLQIYAPIENIITSTCYEDWIGTTSPHDTLEDQALRRDYRRLSNLLIELSRLVSSNERALALVRSRVAEEEEAQLLAAAAKPHE